MLRIPTAAALAALLAWPAFAETPYEGGSPAKGQAFALGTCTPCHVVASGQRAPTRFAIAPSFAAIANTKGMTATALAAFLSSPHPNMPNLILTRDEQRHVIAYILSLKGKQ